ncbi:hypothetical protein BGX20_010497 [Mortierella sp. AD010]|nr:hypothetical protein BGX20_010497 [Mortierella sp. AD010]
MAVEVLLGMAFACHLTSAQKPNPPRLATAMAYGSDDSKLYIMGGVIPNTNITVDQFYYLDLAVSWDVAAPKWIKLDVSSSGGSSGTLDRSGRFIVAAAQQSNMYIYGPNGFDASGRYSGQSTWNSLQIGKTTWNSGPILTTIVNTTNGDELVYYFGSDSSFNAVLVHNNTLQKELNATLNRMDTTIPQGTSAVSTSSIGIIRAEADTTENRYMTVQLFNTTTQMWTNVNITPADKVPARTGHCFVPNKDKNMYYLFGGTSDSKITLGDFYSLDINNLVWTTLNVTNNTRTSMACAVANNMFIVWGGNSSSTEGNSSSTEGNSSSTEGNTPLLYDFVNNTWEVEKFVSANNVSLGDGSQAPQPKKSPSVGAIVGGIVAGVVVAAVALGFLFIRRRKPAKNQTALARSGGKSEISQGSIEMGGYKSIPPPFKSDESYQKSPVVAGTRTSYSEPPPFPSTFPSPSMGVGTGVNQYQQGPVQPRPQSQMSNILPPIIQSPFEPEPDTSSQYLLANPALSGPRPLHSSPLPAVAPLRSGPYHDRQYGGSQETTSEQETSRDMEPATIDLIPITASEAEEGSQVSRSNSLVSTREGRGVGSRSKSIRDGGTGGSLKEPEDSRRDSTESLDYLDIS